MARSRDARTVPALDALKSAVHTAPEAMSDGTESRQVAICLWRTPWISSYEVEPSDDLVIALHTGGARGVRTRIDRRWSSTGSNPGHVHAIPPGMRTAYKPEGELEFLSVHVGRSRLIALDPERPLRPEEMPFRFAFHDPFIASSVRALGDELRAPRERGELFVDSIADAIALHLLREPAPRQAATPVRLALAPRALTRARDRIDASLETGVSLAELADEVGLSRFHFARAFRAATGLPPHQYLTSRRIERAKDLLLHTDLSLPEIALAVGFSSQSHFTHRFRLIVGTTPSQFRDRG